MKQQFVKPLFLRALNAAFVVVWAVLLGGCMRAPAHATLPTWSVPSLPDTAAGRQFDAYLQAFNAGDEAALQQFIADHFTPSGPGGADIKTRTNSQLRLYNTSHGLNLYEITESQETALTVIAQLRLSQEWRRITFMVEDQPPHLVSGIMLQPVDAPVMASPVALSNEQLQQQIDTYVRELVAADRFSGVVLVAKDGTPVFEGAYGLANKEQAIPNQLATRFSVASTSKMFTAVAIAQLVEAGKVTYDAPISTYLPDYPAQVAQRVTVDHLLTHRSGLVDFFADSQRFARVKDSPNPQRDYPAIFMHEPLRFTPGQHFEYSNSNYILLWAIIERVSGESYTDYLRTHIWEPAGMSETSLSSQGIDAAVLAQSYTELADDGQIKPGTRHLFTGDAPSVGSAAGGAYTTVGDLLKFDRALRTNKLLAPVATELLLTDRIEYERPGYRYGYGFIFRRAGNEPIVGHSGGFPGVDAQFDMSLDRGYTVIVLANYELVAEPIVMHLQQILP